MTMLKDVAPATPATVHSIIPRNSSRDDILMGVSPEPWNFVLRLPPFFGLHKVVLKDAHGRSTCPRLHDAEASGAGDRPDAESTLRK